MLNINLSHFYESFWYLCLGHWGHRGCAEVTFSFLFKTPTIWVFTDSPGPQQSGFDIISWLGTPRTLRTPRVYRGHLVIFVSNPYNMGVYGLTRTPVIKIWHLCMGACLYYNSLGSRSEQGRPEGPILRVLHKATILPWHWWGKIGDIL